MKKIPLLILSLTFMSCLLFESDNEELNVNEFIGDVILETQQDVDEFGANNYTSINGKLTIGSILESNASITNINSLNTLIYISKNLFIIRNDSLKNINGLSNLTSVGLYLSINQNGSLSSLNGLDNLNNVGATLQVSKNENLENIDGLSGLKAVGENMMVTENSKLQNINGLSNVTSFNGGLNISKNHSLTSIEGVNNLTSIYHLMIGHNILITNLDPLNNISSIDPEGTINIVFNADLIDFCGIEKLVASNNYTIANNGYNPTYQNFVDENCSL